MNSAATAPAERVIGKCRNGHVVNLTLAERAAAYDAGTARPGWLPCPCGSVAMERFMAVKLVEKPCSDKCTGATGPVCSCSCGGENHGGRHTFA